MRTKFGRMTCNEWCGLITMCRYHNEGPSITITIAVFSSVHQVVHRSFMSRLPRLNIPGTMGKRQYNFWLILISRQRGRAQFCAKLDTINHMPCKHETGDSTIRDANEPSQSRVAQGLMCYGLHSAQLGSLVNKVELELVVTWHVCKSATPLSQLGSFIEGLL